MSQTERRIVLVDLSSIAYPIWLQSGKDPDPDAACGRIVQRVHALASDCQHAAICCDSGRSFRRDLSPEYKANRPEKNDVYLFQIRQAQEQLAADGFPVWAAKGFEADDLIATATSRALALDDETTVLIVTGDKDLLQLVNERVTVKKAQDGSLVTAADVVTKFGVDPSQMLDYLTLVGDSSDNVRGCKGIGAKRAAELLSKYRTLDGLYQALGAPALNGLSPSIVTALREFQADRTTTRQLIALRTDAEIPFDEVLAERASRIDHSFAREDEDAMNETPQTPEPPAVTEPQTEAAMAGPVAAPTAVQAPARAPEPNRSLAIREPDVLAPVPEQWERQLDPRSMRQAQALAEDMFKARTFGGINPQSVLATIMVGRELGVPAMSALRNIHLIEGKHTLSASLMVALVLRSGLAEYFEMVESDDKKATFETKRVGGRRPITLTHTIEMAQQAQLVKPNSNWTKVPTDMLVARCQSRLARLVYPDLLAGLYTPDEIAEVREQVA